jgi:hypothetical protein
MPETVNEGPYVSAGSLLNGPNSGTAAPINPMDGPSLFYQGEMFPDPRFSPINKDGLSPGRIKAYFNSPSVVLVDAIPSATTTANVAADQAPSTTAGVALTLITAQVGTAAGVPVLAPGIPIIPVGTSVATTVLAIDFGFATGTTAANSSTVVVDDNRKFQLGQWIVIPGVGASGNTNTPLFTQVQSISTNTTVITISPSAATVGNNLPIGQGNLYNTLLPPASQFGPAAASANAAEPYRYAGLGVTFDPLQGVARALNITAASIGSGTTAVTVTGYDIYNNLMTELLTANGTNIVNGKKAFKYIRSIVVATAATTVTPANIGIGLSDVFGVNLRMDRAEYVTVGWNGCSPTTQAGFTTALATSSNATTVDVRGTINASTLAVATVASTNGARRLTVIMNVPINNMLNATPNATAALFGAPQA